MNVLGKPSNMHKTFPICISKTCLATCLTTCVTKKYCILSCVSCVSYSQLHFYCECFLAVWVERKIRKTASRVIACKQLLEGITITTFACLDWVRIFLRVGEWRSFLLPHWNIPMALTAISAREVPLFAPQNFE